MFHCLHGRGLQSTGVWACRRSWCGWGLRLLGFCNAWCRWLGRKLALREEWLGVSRIWWGEGTMSRFCFVVRARLYKSDCGVGAEMLFLCRILLMWGYLNALCEAGVLGSQSEIQSTLLAYDQRTAYHLLHMCLGVRAKQAQIFEIFFDGWTCCQQSGQAPRYSCPKSTPQRFNTHFSRVAVNKTSYLMLFLTPCFGGMLSGTPCGFCGFWRLSLNGNAGCCCWSGALYCKWSAGGRLICRTSWWGCVSVLCGSSRDLS